MGEIKKIILHCSDSEWGTAISIDKYHREQKGWTRIGYLGVILNGTVSPGNYWNFADGAFEWGRPLDADNWLAPDEVEAQALGLNSTTVGICMVGKKKFSKAQFLTAKKIINLLRSNWELEVFDVIGHYEVDTQGKTCPNIDMDLFRQFLLDDSVLQKLNVR